MPIFIPDDEEELRRRRAPVALPNTTLMKTPPFNPTAGGIPGGSLGPSMPNRPQTRYQEMQEAKSTYLQGTPGTKKSALLGIAQGALRGLASGNGLGGAIGGALAGGAFGGINPRGQREMQFNDQVRPKIAERWAYEDMDRAQQAADAKAWQDAAMNRAQLENINSQIQSRQAGDALNQQKANREANKPTVLSPGSVLYDPRTQKPVFTAPQAQKPPTAAELTIDPESGMSVEEMAEASYQGRGGDQYVFDKLPERTRRLINGEDNLAAPEEVASANRAYQAAINRQRQADLNYTRGHIRSRALGARRGGGAGPQSQPTRSTTPQAQQRRATPQQQSAQTSPPQQRPGEAEARAEVERLKREADEAGVAYERFQARERFHKPLYYSWPLAKMAEGVDNAADWIEGVKVMDKKSADEVREKYYRAQAEYARNYPSKPPVTANTGSRRSQPGRRAISVQEAAGLLQ